MVGAASADVVEGEGSEEAVEAGDSDDEGAVESSVGAKEVSEGAGDDGGDESKDWEEGVLNGYAGTVGTVGFARVGNSGTPGTVKGSGIKDGSSV